jgi:hypothetical protein
MVGGRLGAVGWLAAPLAAGMALVPHDHRVSASFHDSQAERADALDISGVDVTRRADGSVVLRLHLLNRPELTPDMGIEAVVDLDGSEATGDPSLRLGLGVDRLVTVLAGTPRLFRWRQGVGWLAVPPPRVAYIAGTATITLSGGQVGHARRFRFAVSVASRMVAEPDGTFDITDARYDFAPDVGDPAWTFRDGGRP